MKIKEIKVFVTNPGRNFVTVKVITEDGTYGLGDATVNGRELAVVAYLEEHVIPCLIGRDAHTIEDIWQYLYRGVYWRKGPIGMASIAAIDMALWDIKGKVAGLPVYQLLGGKSRKGVTLYAHANGETIEETLDKAQEHIDQGFKVIRLQTAVPGLSETYGILGDKKDYFELQGNRPLPPEQTWSTAKYFKLVPELFKQARARFGDEIHFTHDVHSRLTPIESAKLGKILEEYNLFFLEDSSMAENQENYKVIRQHTTTPLAIGETYNTIWDCKDLMQNQLIDYIRAAATHAGGITGLKKITDFAAIFNIRSAPHGAPDLSPICFAAHMHLNISTHNFGIQEFVGFGNEASKKIFKHDMRLENGMIMVSDAPGLGIEFDETEAEKYTYVRSYLPVCRLEDGTVWDW